MTPQLISGYMSSLNSTLLEVKYYSRDNTLWYGKY